MVLGLWVRRTQAPNIVELDLEHGEKQLWIGTPRHGLIFTRADAIISVAAIVWLMIAYGWQASVLPRLDVTGVVLSLIGLPFVVVGLYALPVRFFLDARRRKLTTYAITPRRAITLVGSTMTSRPLGELRDARVLDHGNGTGSIVFGRSPLPAMSALASDEERMAALKVHLGQKHGTIDQRQVFGYLTGELFARLWPARFERIEQAPYVHGLILQALARNDS
jgi:hypothetical protein